MFHFGGRLISYFHPIKFLSTTPQEQSCSDISMPGISYRMCTRLFFLGGSTTIPTLSFRFSSVT